MYGLMCGEREREKEKKKDRNPMIWETYVRVYSTMGDK